MEVSRSEGRCLGSCYLPSHACTGSASCIATSRCVPTSIHLPLRMLFLVKLLSAKNRIFSLSFPPHACKAGGLLLAAGQRPPVSCKERRRSGQCAAAFDRLRVLARCSISSQSRLEPPIPRSQLRGAGKTLEGEKSV
eukprot:3402797-Rhodomonas_salina.1